MLMDLRSPSVPALRTVQWMSVPSMASTENSMMPSSTRMEAPGSSALASSTILRHDAACALHVNFREREALPRRKLHGWCQASRPARISGPFVSSKIAHGLAISGAHAAQRSIRRACSCVPWLKLKRAMSMPAAIVARSFDSSSTAGLERADDLRSFCHGFLPGAFAAFRFCASTIQQNEPAADVATGSFDCFARKGLTLTQLLDFSDPRPCRLQYS